MSDTSKPSCTENDCISCGLEPAQKPKKLCGTCQELANLNRTGVTRQRRQSNTTSTASFVN